MKCTFCHQSDIEDGFTSLFYERKNSAVRVQVENVPAEICPHCGEVYLTENVAQQIYERVAPVLAKAPTNKPSRQFGSAKGLVIIHDDFDEPLEEFADYM